MLPLISYAIDVGSTRPTRSAPEGAFGWARATRSAEAVVGGTSIGAMLHAMREDARAGALVTLGIEAPLWIPVPVDEGKLSTGRDGERSRSCFAPAGGYVALLGLHQLAHVASRLPPEWALVLDWRQWSRSDAREVLIWEAFVSTTAHAQVQDADAHVRDAATAAVEFVQRADDLRSDVAPDDRPTLSLAGTALLWARRATDIQLLASPTLVLRPTRRFEGRIDGAPLG